MTEAAAAPRRVRQWVTLRGGSMDLRAGSGNCGEFPHALRSAVGRPHGCALLTGAAAPETAVETLRRNLSDQGFDLRVAGLPASGCTLAAAGELDALLAELRITADDLVVAVGDYRELSVASFACSSWCGGVSLAEVPTDPASALLAGPTPRALDLPGLPRRVSQEGSARFCLVDTDLFDPGVAPEPARLAYALMVQTAMCDGDKAFGELWDSADELVSGSPDALVERLQASIKSRGKVASSTSVATRQSLEYGTSFAAALGTLTAGEASPSTLLADGMRFAARLSVAQETLSIDDMFTQDELLERLGLGTTETPVEAAALVDAIRAERYARTNRLMLGLPRSLGRVRLAVVSDELLEEHVGAWCAARSE